MQTRERILGGFFLELFGIMEIEELEIIYDDSNKKESSYAISTKLDKISVFLPGLSWLSFSIGLG